MNKRLLIVLMVGSLIAAVSTSAPAKGTGKVEFSGRIVADICAIDIDGARANTVVTSADACLNSFDGDGTLSPTKSFQISPAKCDLAIASLNLRFNGDIADGEDLYLKDDLSDAGAATNVGITITNSNGGNTDVVFDDSVPVSTTNVVNTDGEVTPSIFNYTAKVIQIGDEKLTTGKYRAPANFIVFYR